MTIPGERSKGLLGRASERLRQRLSVYRALITHPRTPRLSRILLGCAVAYLLSPVDLIPDFIPVLGLLDDLLIVPLLVGAALLLIPATVRAECRGGSTAH